MHATAKLLIKTELNHTFSDYAISKIYKIHTDMSYYKNKMQTEVLKMNHLFFFGLSNVTHAPRVIRAWDFSSTTPS